MKKISWQDFEDVELRVGTILEVENFLGAKIPAYKVMVDFGEYGIKRSSARITDLYTSDGLVGKQVIGVINFAPKKVGPFISEVLITGFYREDGRVVLAVPDKPVKNGSKLG
ncbi:tRNA-binding protein [Parcubacteria bacterium SG8_24]|nr:MAG: tRNA-binding protein [Parcubacteria bacterium SG8_24]